LILRGPYIGVGHLYMESDYVRFSKKNSLLFLFFGAYISDARISELDAYIRFSNTQKKKLKCLGFICLCIYAAPIQCNYVSIDPILRVNILRTFDQ